MIREEGLDCRVDGEACGGTELESRVEHAADDADRGVSIVRHEFAPPRLPRVLGRDGHQERVVGGYKDHCDT